MDGADGGRESQKINGRKVTDSIRNGRTRAGRFRGVRNQKK